MAAGHHITELSLERATPEEMAGRLMESEHRGRYLWAARLARRGDVLDAGCGSGYGSEILAQAGAARVVGIDIAADAVTDARAQFSSSSTRFEEADLHALPFPDESFDLAVCFEVIEHVQNQEQAIQELRRVLRADSVLAISSPNRNVYPPGNPHHTHEFTPDELAELLGRHFSNVRLFRQSPWLTAAILDDQQSQDSSTARALPLPTVKVGSVAPGGEVFTIALASDGELPDIEPLSVIGDPFEVRWWEDQVKQAVADRDFERQGARAQEERARAEQLQALRAQREERRQHGAALLAAERELAEALEQVAVLRANEGDLQRWATEEIQRRDRALTAADQARRDFENRLRRAEATISDVTTSLSWRLTVPLRALKRLLS